MCTIKRCPWFACSLKAAGSDPTPPPPRAQVARTYTLTDFVLKKTYIYTYIHICIPYYICVCGIAVPCFLDFQRQMKEGTSGEPNVNTVHVGCHIVAWGLEMLARQSLDYNR